MILLERFKAMGKTSRSPTSILREISKNGNGFSTMNVVILLSNIGVPVSKIRIVQEWEALIGESGRSDKEIDNILLEYFIK